MNPLLDVAGLLDRVAMTSVSIQHYMKPGTRVVAETGRVWAVDRVEVRDDGSVAMYGRPIGVRSGQPKGTYSLYIEQRDGAHNPITYTLLDPSRVNEGSTK